jgi:DNA-directed RNA polymerase specialized sigma24 family protein
VAAFLLARSGVVRRRVLKILRGHGLEIVGRSGLGGLCQCDPDDVTSSVIRRVDLAVLRGVLRARTEPEFWAFVLVIADNTTLNKVQAELVRRCVRLNNAPEPAAARSDSETDTLMSVHRALLAAQTDSDRELIYWKLRNTSYAEIAAATGRSEQALRTQWAKLRRHLRGLFWGPPHHPITSHPPRR